LPLAQQSSGRATLVVRGNSGGSMLPASALRGAVAGLDAGLPLFGVSSMSAHIATSLWRQRLAAGLLAVFGTLAVALAAMGVYGVAAHSVSQRTREIGIRMAIGARGAEISALVVREGMRWVLAGAVAGLPGALLAMLAMRRGIPGVKAFDPWVVAATVGLLAAISVLATWLPARRAARVDPMIALRCE